jgi:DNA-3-methyladenine glycosylase I
MRSDPLMVAYHDTEWGVPIHDDQKLFEFMVLDAMQAGLNWRIVLEKRQNFKQALDGFDPRKIAKYADRQLDRLVRTEGSSTIAKNSPLQLRTPWPL